MFWLSLPILTWAHVSRLGDAQGPGNVLFSDGAGGTVPATIAAADDWTDGFILTTVPASAASGPVLVETGTGQSGSLEFAVTTNATFSPSTIAWTETQALPVAISGHSANYVRIEDGGGATVERGLRGRWVGPRLDPRDGRSLQRDPSGRIARHVVGWNGAVDGRRPPRRRGRHSVQLQGRGLRLHLCAGRHRDEGWTAGQHHLPRSAERQWDDRSCGERGYATRAAALVGCTGSSENSYATINSDGTLGSFGGATGSNTLQSVGGVNLFNTRGVSYVDGSGVAPVMILAGDDVNSPGTKTNKVIFY